MEGVMLLSSKTRPYRILHVILTVFFAALAGLAFLPAARANQMTLFTCHAPNGEAVGNAGWTIQRTPDQFMTASDTCGPQNTGSLHLELAANSAGYPDQAGIDWIFQAPAWATIAEYAIQAPDSYAYPNNGTGAGQAAVWANDESDPIYDYRNLGGGTWGQTTIQRTPPDNVSWIALNTSCDARCPAGAVIARLDVSAVRLLLNDQTIPTVSDLSGPLVSGGTLSGTVSASFLAADDGPGVYSAWLVIDGQPQPRVMLDSNNGLCTTLGQTLDSTRSFSHPDPCAQSASAHITLDTASLTDGTHTIQLMVDDASGSTTTGYDATITTHNTPTIAPSAPGSAIPGSGALASYSPSAPASGQSLANVTKSSQVSANYCAHQQASEASKHQHWRITLNVTPHRIRRGTPITLSGSVSSCPRPNGGKIVYLRARSVHYTPAGNHSHRKIRRYGPWRTFLLLHTQPNGRFTAKYRIRFGGNHTYQFAAVAPQEGAYLPHTGTSRISTVDER